MKNWIFGSICLSSIVGAIAAPTSPSQSPIECPLSDSFYLDSPALTAGYDEGAYFETSNSKTSLKLNVLTQNRAVYDSRGKGFGLTPFQNTWGFENTRDAVNFSGTVAEDGYYNLRLEVGAYDHTLKLPWAYGGYAMSDNWNFAMGMMHVPTTREWVINDEFQLDIARSVTTNHIMMRYPSIQMGYTNDIVRLNAYFGSSSAGGATAGPLVSVLDSIPFGYARYFDSFYVGARFDWIALGDSSQGMQSSCPPGQGPDSSGRPSTGNWARFREFTSPWGEKPILLVGAWGSYIRSHFVSTVPGIDSVIGNLWIAAVDMQAQLGGGSLYLLGWVEPNRFKTTSGTLFEHTTPWGVLGQGGFYVVKTFELVARYEYGNWQNGPVISFTTLPSRHSNIVTAGFNWYMNGQSFKISGDYGFSWNSVGNFTSFPEFDSTDWLFDAPGHSSQQLVRIQLQTFF